MCRHLFNIQKSFDAMHLEHILFVFGANCKFHINKNSEWKRVCAEINKI